MAKVIVSLLSDDFGWVTAQDIEVSGGHLLESPQLLCCFG
nr:hypothetical protein [Paenibacillus sp. FSL R7-0331]